MFFQNPSRYEVLSQDEQETYLNEFLRIRLN
jgi:hypothetical protein